MSRYNIPYVERFEWFGFNDAPGPNSSETTTIKQEKLQETEKEKDVMNELLRDMERKFVKPSINQDPHCAMMRPRL